MTAQNDEITWPHPVGTSLISAAAAPLETWALGHGNLIASLVATLLAVWAGIRAAKAFCGQAHGVTVTLSDAVGGLHSLPGGLSAWGAAIALSVLLPLVHTAPLVGFLGLAAIIAAIVLPVVGARRVVLNLLAWRRMREGWLSTLSVIFGVPEKVVEIAGFAGTPDGGVVISSVPPAMAAKLADRAKIEAQIEAVAPHLMLDPTSTESRIILRAVDGATAQRRAAIAASGGLLGAEIDPNQPAAVATPFGMPAPAPAPEAIPGQFDEGGW